MLKSREIARASDGLPYVRRGAQNLRVDTEDGLTRLRRDKGIESFERETINANPEVITNSVVTLEFLINVIPTAEPDPWLSKQLLLRSGKPTVAGIVLFAEEPQALLPKRCGVKIYRYKTTQTEGTRETLAFDPITIEGHLIDQIGRSVSTTVELVEEIRQLGPKGLMRISYPFETLHEILTNAVLHRDYSIPSDVHIRIFDNRIEVESPGTLPGHVTTENILEEQFARNPSIVRMINKFPDPPNKDVGEGLRTAFDAMRKIRLKQPIILETPTSVRVEIRHEALASPEDAVMEYLEHHDEIVNRIGRRITGIQSENVMKDVFYRLRDAGMIARVMGTDGPKNAWKRTDKKREESTGQRSFDV